MKTKYLLFGFLVSSLIGCTDLQSQYMKALSDAASPIQDKYAYLEKMFLDSKKDTNCVEYDRFEEIPFGERKKLLVLLSEKADDNVNDSAFWILHSPAGNGYNTGDIEIFGKTIFDRKSFNRFMNDTVYSKDDMESNLWEFDKYIVKPLQAAKYLLLFTDKIYVSPRANLTDYETGFVLSNVKVYNIDSKELIDSFDVAAQNSSSVRLSTDEAYLINISTAGVELNKNLYDNLKKKAISKVNKNPK